MSKEISSTDHRQLHIEDWLRLMLEAKQSGLSTTEIRLFLQQAASK
ncbi:DNA-binding anti-repressor SinI [Aquibacillus halophilus]|uniref:DNA-binding anti-repressor SinI n=1 Tax=Aquibacillus halophilus TaxID=930132 RepID=A0A6A8D687_9BACI|nr:DNA-binding anti-repressor SinI [Aquibacillus halophilus]MRH41098.1 DNA-binding anti-repressor SinI [Aquibacillus halophilus]